MSNMTRISDLEMSSAVHEKSLERMDAAIKTVLAEFTEMKARQVATEDRMTIIEDFVFTLQKMVITTKKTVLKFLSESRRLLREKETAVKACEFDLPLIPIEPCVMNSRGPGQPPILRVTSFSHHPTLEPRK